ncbi:YczE/YyaS/YitT family protein [Actinomyces faecalis]|uniref:membrane protein YczE n=1 Tax=Actinomyces faecalis TaxID=2722820 RepID=UPI0015549580|nr:hypothetical protein [Actinomyces faecalis]
MILDDRGPLAQLRAGRLPRRLCQLLVGQVLLGASQGMLVRSCLGNAPWDVFHQGVSLHSGMSIGTVTIIVGVLVLLAWIPLRIWPGLGTVLNAVLIGLSLDVTVSLLPVWQHAGARTALMVMGVLLNGLAGGLYIGAQFGPGPRDGLMTGLHARTGVSMRLVRTGVEVSVVLIGWALGGIIGVGTVVYALAIGPLTQFFLERCIVRLPRTGANRPAPADLDENGADHA